MLASGPIAIKAAKVAIDRGSQVDIATGMLIEESSYARVIPTEDRLEGLKAFREKRLACECEASNGDRRSQFSYQNCLAETGNQCTRGGSRTMSSSFTLSLFYHYYLYTFLGAIWTMSFPIGFHH